MTTVASAAFCQAQHAGSMLARKIRSQINLRSKNKQKFLFPQTSQFEIKSLSRNFT
jgi:hypothetical protein